jgi:hypothetical protein
MLLISLIFDADFRHHHDWLRHAIFFMPPCLLLFCRFARSFYTRGKCAL